MTSPSPDEQPTQPVAPQPTYVDPITGAPLYVDPVSGQLVYGPTPGAPTPDLAPTTVPLASGNVSSPYAQPTEGMPAGYPPTGYQPAGYPPAGYPPAGYPPAAGGYAYQIGAYPYAVGRRTNGLAIASLVCGISAFPMLSCYGVGAIAGLVAAILGHVSRKQIRERGDSGAGMALAGIICGYAAVVIGVGIIGFFVWIFTHLADQGGITVN